MSQFFKKTLPITGALTATVLGAEDYYTHHIPPQKFETACNGLGINNPTSVIKLLCLSGTLTPTTIWQNTKRAELPNQKAAWSHMTKTLQKDLYSRDYDNAAKKYFGSNLSWLDRILGKKELMSHIEATKLLIAQTQEFFGRKRVKKEMFLDNRTQMPK